MNITAYANDDQLAQVDVTIKLTMKLSEWRMISESLRRDAQANYQWTKVDVANEIERVFNEFHSVVIKEVKP